MCFVQNYCASRSKRDPLATICGFNGQGKAVDATLLLTDIADEVRREGMPRHIAGKQTNENISPVLE